MDPETIDQTLRHRTSTGQDQEPPNEEPQQAQGQPSPAEPDAEEQTCRICLTGTDPDLGPLLSPCLCRGTQSKVHSLCLNTWREAARGQSSFWQCDQCRYRYRFGHRTRIAGLATNPYAVPVLTFFAFMFLVFISGFCASGVLWATNLLPSQPIFEDFSYYLLGTNPWSSPLDYGELLGGSIEKSFEVFHPDRPTILQRLLWSSGIDLSPDSWTLKTLTHFSLGFSVIGILSFLQFAISYSLVAPLHHFRLFRRANGGGNRRAGERDRGLDTAAILAVAFVIIGAIKAIRALYGQVQKFTKWLLGRLEVTILEAR